MQSLVPSSNTSQVTKNVQGILCRCSGAQQAYSECLYVFPKDKLCMINFSKISPLDNVLQTDLRIYKTTQPSFNMPPM